MAKNTKDLKIKKSSNRTGWIILGFLSAIFIFVWVISMKGDKNVWYAINNGTFWGFDNLSYMLFLLSPGILLVGFLAANLLQGGNIENERKDVILTRALVDFLNPNSEAILDSYHYSKEYFVNVDKLQNSNIGNFEIVLMDLSAQDVGIFLIETDSGPREYEIKYSTDEVYGYVIDRITHKIN